MRVVQLKSWMLSNIHTKFLTVLLVTLSGKKNKKQKKKTKKQKNKKTKTKNKQTNKLKLANHRTIAKLK
jgi:hypothetical protein